MGIIPDSLPAKPAMERGTAWNKKNNKNVKNMLQNNEHYIYLFYDIGLIVSIYYRYYTRFDKNLVVSERHTERIIEQVDGM